MKANADMLGVMSFNGELIRNAQMRVGHLSRLGRSMIQSSGSAIRVAALLELVDRPAFQTRPGSFVEGVLGQAGIEVRSLDVQTPTGVRLLRGVDLTVTKGDGLLIHGASGAHDRLQTTAPARLGCVFTLVTSLQGWARHRYAVPSKACGPLPQAESGCRAARCFCRRRPSAPPDRWSTT